MSQSASRLLDLPEPCLLAVLHCCTDDHRSLFSAARAHSRLHQAAVQSLSSVRAMLHQQQQMDSVLLYMTNHGQHVSSIDIDGLRGAVLLQELPHTKLQGLSSLNLSRLYLQLQQRHNNLGVLGHGQPDLQLHLTQLQLHSCKLADEYQLAAALLQLPKLQHLSLVWDDDAALDGSFSSSALQGLQQLTYLELTVRMLDPGLGLESLKDLTSLQDLRLHCQKTYCVLARVVSDLQQLTHLKVQGEKGYTTSAVFEASALAGKTQLQHLELVQCTIIPIKVGRSPGSAELLSHLEHVQQLTFLSLSNSLCTSLGPPITAYSALTASSKLQHLDLSG